MPTIRLTQTVVDRIGPPPTGRIEYFDSLLPSFGLRLAASGHKSWVVFYRCGGRQRRYTLASVAVCPKVDEARNLAREVLRDVARGIDPAEKKAVAVARRPDTVRSVVEQFIERYAKTRNRSWAVQDRNLRNHVLPTWGERDITTITRRDMLDLLDGLMDRNLPTAANRVLATLRTMFAWAVERDILSASPAVNVKPPGKEIERDRVLSDAELTLIWQAADRISVAAGGFIKVLVLLGQRRDEVAKMRWEDLDLVEGRLWTLPREATKGDRSHEVPLSGPVLDVLAAMPRLGAYVFTSRADRPISGYSKIKANIDRLAGIETPWRLHDLRRSCGTGLARLGIPVSTISRVLNHAEGGVTKIYNRYSYADEKRHALEIWAQHVAGLTQSTQAPLRRLA